MQLPSPRERSAGPARERSHLHSETRHSAMLLGGSIGVMVMFALVLFLGTNWLAR